MHAHPDGYDGRGFFGIVPTNTPGFLATGAADVAAVGALGAVGVGSSAGTGAAGATTFPVSEAVKPSLASDAEVGEAAGPSPRFRFLPDTAPVAAEAEKGAAALEMSGVAAADDAVTDAEAVLPPFLPGPLTTGGGAISAGSTTSPLADAAAAVGVAAADADSDARGGGSAPMPRAGALLTTVPFIIAMTSLLVGTGFVMNTGSCWLMAHPLNPAKPPTKTGICSEHATDACEWSGTENYD